MAMETYVLDHQADATARNLTGAVNAMIEQSGLRIIAQQRMRITREQAETFYAVHRARPFFGELVDFMTSGPVVVQVLEGEDAIAKYRDLMGQPIPRRRRPGTIRKIYAKSIGENSVHVRMPPRPRSRKSASSLPATRSWPDEATRASLTSRSSPLRLCHQVGICALFAANSGRGALRESEASWITLSESALVGPPSPDPLHSRSTGSGLWPPDDSSDGRKTPLWQAGSGSRKN